MRLEEVVFEEYQNGDIAVHFFPFFKFNVYSRVFVVPTIIIALLHRHVISNDIVSPVKGALRCNPKYAE